MSRKQIHNYFKAYEPGQNILFHFKFSLSYYIEEGIFFFAQEVITFNATKYTVRINHSTPFKTNICIFL